MDTRHRSLTALIAVALVACAEPTPAASDTDTETDEYRAEREALRRETAALRASAFRDLYHAWDDREAARAGIHPKFHASWRESVEWLRPRLGTCGAAEPIDRHARDSHGRFRYDCENGALEIELWIDYGLVGRALFGGRGIEASEPVRAAAEEVALAMPLTASDLERWPAADRIMGDFAASLGRCAIRGTDIVGDRGGLFYLDCEGGPAHFKITLSARDGEPSVLRLYPEQDENHRYLGPQGV